MNQTLAIDTVERILVASPSRLIVMLYDEALKNLETAVAAVERGDIETRCHAVNRAIEIVCHLYLTLDNEQGGVIAEKLGAIYRFVLARLPQTNIANDAEPAREAIRLLTPMRASWHELDERIEASVAVSESRMSQPMAAAAAMGA
jgi:flagellar protein FliS